MSNLVYNNIVEASGRTRYKRSNKLLKFQMKNLIKLFIHLFQFMDVMLFSMVYGHISSLGMKLQRDRLCASFKRVDPQNSRLRWAAVITRRTYSVPGLGHHRLINWGFVIHGCRDGFSCLILFLKCATNNKKETVDALFLKKYSWQSRIRTDYGGGNT